jgi:hypothetical protein
MNPLLRRNLLRSFLWGVGLSIAAYALTWGLVTTHEELGISTRAAVSVALWTFPIVFACSALFYIVKGAATRRH